MADIALSSPERCAIAVDLGTTTITAALLNLSDMGVVTRRTILNPQRELGLDVISRLTAAEMPGGMERLRLLVNGALEGLVEELQALAPAGVAVEAVGLAGNTVMQHLLLGLPVDTLSRPPYRPRETGPRTVSTASLGWRRHIPMHIFPQPGGFVGGDLVAFLYGLGLAPPLPHAPCPRLFLDLGTNAEIALLSGGRLLATSAAAGPAFEAGNLSCGMAALPGAISAVDLGGERPRVRVLGDGRPEGFCGTGAISAVAALLRAGLLTASGQLLPGSAIASNLANYVTGEGRDAAFVFYRDAAGRVALTQEDIRQVQLAVAAVRAGLEVLRGRGGAGETPIDPIITGSFVAGLEPDDLWTLGLLPPGADRRCRLVENGALTGVIRALATPGGMGEAAALARALTLVPLSGTPRFEELFISHLTFPV